MRLKISKKQLEILGDATISGRLATEFPDWRSDKQLILVFEETSQFWKQKNDGPDLLIIPEHVPSCLVENIIFLISQGYNITVERETKDPG